MGQMVEQLVDTQVLVVGAGPVGLLVAGELRLAGVDVVVVERLPEPTGESRASQLNSRTMELFDQRGLLDRLGPVQSEPAGHFGGLTVEVGQVPSLHAGHWKVPQADTEAMLQAWATELGADVRRGHELQELVAREDQVEAEVASPDGPVRFRASYLVGCDGEHSTVRQLAGFDFPGTDATRELLRADVAGIDVPNRRFERRERGLAIAAKRGDGITRVMLHELGRPARRRTGAPDFGEVVEAWARVVGEDISGGTPVWVNAFDNASRQVAQYRKGRILVAGDAAHRQMPIGGQALNLGLHDAFNLGWKLAAQVHGWAPTGLLDSYHDERHPVGTRVLAGIRAQELLLLGGAEVEALRSLFGELLDIGVAHQHLAARASGLDVRYDVDPGDHPLLGARLPHRDLVTRSGPVTTTDLLRSGRGLLLDLSGADARSGERLEAAPRWADRVQVVTAREELRSDGVLAEDGAVLVRPDGHIVWTDTGGADLHTALCRWFGAPRAEHAPRPEEEAAYL